MALLIATISILAFIVRIAFFLDRTVTYEKDLTRILRQQITKIKEHTSGFLSNLKEE
jgi:hypothetical protein